MEIKGNKQLDKVLAGMHKAGEKVGRFGGSIGSVTIQPDSVPFQVVWQYAQQTGQFVYTDADGKRLARAQRQDLNRNVHTPAVNAYLAPFRNSRNEANAELKAQAKAAKGEQPKRTRKPAQASASATVTSGKNPINPATGKPFRGRPPIGGWPTA